ncbi:hypothetical protein TRFO_20547 [Tritrichomonas foetus]|uniref:Uncharacterized protein n=1 Tax=Tritrichomonas foetus TaxID=1144522 RepID=A0A1J4KFE6_9EUKA|nr:hypothetical protein TRFO_20547 [Tritrichomonas foetus]|eukprot:OHT10177.1 hypothetical protein TRFO_20547 [Tritrichomonas foetus]
MHPRRNFNGVSGSNNSRGRGNATRGGRVHNRGENSQNRRYHSRRGGNENRRKYDQERRANITIKSKEQALKELECKLNPKIYDLDKKLFSEINKYSTIFKMVSESFLDDEFATKGFILICKVYSQPQIVDSTNKDIKSTIYSRFFENDRFIFANIFSNVLINMLADESDSDNIKSILALFYTLFKVCKQNANKLTREIHTLKKIKMKIPEKYQLSVNEFLDKADKVLYSVYDNNSDESDDEEVSILESTVAPNASDLFGNPRVPKNHVDSGYDNVKKYLNVLYALTKENFYLPIRTHLAELRQDKLDYRDLYLYENVRVKCMNDADILSTDYRDCNLFLSFQIRTPVNCKQKVGIPDWKHTERLGNRSLLILSDSPDCNKIDAVCRSCALARANDRDISRSHINLLNNGVVPVT